MDKGWGGGGRGEGERRGIEQAVGREGIIIICIHWEKKIFQSPGA